MLARLSGSSGDAQEGAHRVAQLMTTRGSLQHCWTDENLDR